MSNITLKDDYDSLAEALGMTSDKVSEKQSGLRLPRLKIIKEGVLNKSTFINFHPGILPNYRGSLSTVWSMLNNEDYVGGTWHYIEKRVDTGNILSQHKIPVTPTSTAFSLNHKIFSKGISEIGNVLELVNGEDKGIKQEGKSRFYYNKFPSLTKEDKWDDDLKSRVNYFPPSFVD